MCTGRLNCRARRDALRTVVDGAGVNFLDYAYLRASDTMRGVKASTRLLYFLGRFGRRGASESVQQLLVAIRREAES